MRLLLGLGSLTESFGLQSILSLGVTCECFSIDGYNVILILEFR